MRISFDLDETLFVSPIEYEIEPPLHYPLAKIYKEKLRKGTVELIHRLQSEGYDVWVYTSSNRPLWYIKGLFYHYGVKFDEIINAAKHEEIVQRNRKQRYPSKMPNSFHISLHIDDEKCVEEWGKLYGFRVFLIGPPDDQWAEKVFEKAEKIKKMEEQNLRYLGGNI